MASNRTRSSLSSEEALRRISRDEVGVEASLWPAAGTESPLSQVRGRREESWRFPCEPPRAVGVSLAAYYSLRLAILLRSGGRSGRTQCIGSV